MSEKLQKVLANAGLGSRREMEKVIDQGRVSVDGSVAKLGDRVEPNQQIRLDGNLIKGAAEKAPCRVLMYHKPEGQICTRNDPEGRPTVFERLPRIRDGRWISIGRLDINTSGLLLLTTDGELANRLMHPRHEIEREYAVRIFGEVSDAIIRKLAKGVALEDGEAKFDKIKRRSAREDESQNQWFDVVLSEGRNREVRRLWESQEVRVSRLIRTRYGDIALKKGLPSGAWLELGLDEVNYLRTSVQLPKETQSQVDENKQKLNAVRTNRLRRTVKKFEWKQRTEGKPD